MSFSVTGAVDAHVLSLEEERLPDGSFHPSGLFGCARKALYGFRGAERTNPPGSRGKRIFRLGHLFHEFIQTAILADPEIEAFYPEVKAYHPVLNLKGHADGLLKFKSGRWKVLELKSIGSYGFKKKDLPQPAHVSQAVAYGMTIRDWGCVTQDGLQIPAIPDLDSVLFCYVNKETGETAEFNTTLTEARELVVWERVNALVAHERDGTLPARLPLVNKKGIWVVNWECDYCDWKDACWSAPEEVI